MYVRKKMDAGIIKLYFNDIFLFELGTFTAFIYSSVNNVITIVLTSKIAIKLTEWINVYFNSILKDHV